MDAITDLNATLGGAPTVASVVTGKLRPLVRRIDEEGFYPAGVLRALGEAGAFAHHIPRSDGTPGDVLAGIP